MAENNTTQMQINSIDLPDDKTLLTISFEKEFVLFSVKLLVVAVSSFSKKRKIKPRKNDDRITDKVQTEV